jgi:hypothetical protein
MEVRALEVRHGLKALLPYGFFLIPNREKRDRQCCCSYETVLAQGGGVMCAIISTSMLGSLLMTDPNHGYAGLKGIIMITSHIYKSWTLDNQQR